MKQRDRKYLEDIQEVSGQVIEICRGKSREDLDSNLMFRRSLERSFEIIGEAANNLSDEFKSEHSEIPWQKIISMRNHLIHAYMDVEHDILWNVAENKIPELISFIEEKLEAD